MDLITAERRLQTAQRDADLDALDEFLHPREVGVGPDGRVFGKEDDLGAYRSGTLRITRLVEESSEVQDDGPTGVTRIVAAAAAGHQLADDATILCLDWHGNHDEPGRSAVAGADPDRASSPLP